MSKLNPATPVNDPGLTFPPQAQPVQPAERPTQKEQDAADFRLVIEEDQVSGSYIYKTLDRRTGEVIQQFPRDEILKLKEAEDYNAGSIVNARA